MQSTNRRAGSVLLLALSLIFAGCAQDNTDTMEPTTDAQYVGSDACRPCHQAIWETADQGGHAHALTPVVNGQKPGAPLLLANDPPPALTWSNVHYVVGGWGWMARFIGQSDLLVKGAGAQFNVPTEQYPEAGSVDDMTASPVPFDYACFRCHTTGPDQASDTFAEASVRCEACHGPGSLHAATPTRVGMIEDDSAELCGRCHSRATGGTPATFPAGAFLSSNDQYGEMKSGPHDGFKCTRCHAEHSGVRRGQTGGIVRECTRCHEGLTVSHFGDVDCITCHMPHATKSARSRDVYAADVRTHVFKIHAGPEDRSAMFDEEGALKPDYGVTLDYVCYQCHRDAQGVGGTASTKTMQELAAKALLIHAQTGRAANER